MRLGLFGGTFDPIHNGHIAVAREAAAKFGLDRVWLIPAEKPPHKSGATHASYEDRYRMVELACGNDPKFEASSLEKGTLNSYSIDTIEKVRTGLAAGDKLFFLIGADAFAEIKTWRRWEDVVKSVEFIVVSRPGHRYAVPEGAIVHRLETMNLPVSSSEIRQSLARGDYRVDVPDAVLDYIRARGLYGGK